MLKISGSDQLKIQTKSVSMSEKCHTSTSNKKHYKKREKLYNNKLLKQQQWKGIEDEIEMKKHVDNKCNIGHAVVKKQT